MKINRFRTGFTLVEIMIVVVVIGILATLAAPTYKKARNTAIEKMIIHDGRQVALSVNECFSENPQIATTGVTLDKIIGPDAHLIHLSSGNIITNGIIAAATAPANPQPPLSGITLKQGDIFNIANPGYATDISSNGMINGSVAKNSSDTDLAAYTAGTFGLNFSVDTGLPLDASGNTEAPLN